MLRRRNKLSSGSKRAFTLVELIVVLVILAVIAAMLVPALTGYIKRAKREHYYDEAYYARVAAQSVMQELYAAGDNALTNQTTDGNNVIWSSGADKKWGDRILSLMDRGRGAANNEPYIFIFGVASNKASAGQSEAAQHTVYYMAYVADENAPAVFYVNGTWMYQYPRYDDSPAIRTQSFGGENFRNTIVLDGASIPLQFFIVSNRTGINPSNVSFWTGTGSNSLLSHADGYYGK